LTAPLRRSFTSASSSAAHSVVAPVRRGSEEAMMTPWASTSSATPVLRRDWVAKGAHLNVIGASLPDRREVDGATVAAASLFVDRRESTEKEAGDYLLALQEGAIAAGHIQAELGDLLLGRHRGRTSRDEITLFKSLGLAVEDLAAAALVYRRAQDTGTGQQVDF
jgi:ornithine cyclodeaminase